MVEATCWSVIFAVRSYERVCCVNRHIVPNSTLFVTIGLLLVAAAIVGGVVLENWWLSDVSCLCFSSGGRSLRIVTEAAEYVHTFPASGDLDGAL